MCRPTDGLELWFSSSNLPTLSTQGGPLTPVNQPGPSNQPTRPFQPCQTARPVHPLKPTGTINPFNAIRLLQPFSPTRPFQPWHSSIRSSKHCPSCFTLAIQHFPHAPPSNCSNILVLPSQPKPRPIPAPYQSRFYIPALGGLLDTSMFMP